MTNLTLLLLLCAVFTIRALLSAAHNPSALRKEACVIDFTVAACLLVAVAFVTFFHYLQP